MIEEKPLAPATSTPSVSLQFPFPPITENLASAFLSKGEICLLQSDPVGLELFEKVSELDPLNASNFYRQGLALFEYGSQAGRDAALLLACKKFKTATQLKPDFLESWQAWGSTLLTLGQKRKQYHFFLDAEKRMAKALELSASNEVDLLWDYGVVMGRIADQSGEASDYRTALLYFQRATLCQDKLPSEFWNDFGKTCIQAAAQINDIQLVAQGIHCFKQSIALSLSSYDSWINLAEALHKLYNYSHDDDHFAQTNDCFAAVAQLRPQDSTLWLKWATFLLEAGKRNRDPRKLQACIEKCQRYGLVDLANSPILGIWAEALAWMGASKERVDLIQEAHDKIREAFDLSEDHFELTFNSGSCLYASACYFNDIDQFHQAIEQFQEGISMDRTSYRHWHGIASCYTAIGERDEDMDALEKASYFYRQALDLSPCSTFHFDFGMSLFKLGELSHQQGHFEEAAKQFERALAIQKNAVYIHPDWLFYCACALDALGDFHDEPVFYQKAIEIFTHVLMIDPDFPDLHHKLGLACSHLGDLLGDLDQFYRGAHHFRLALKRDEENDHVILDWGVVLINIAEHIANPQEAAGLFREAERKLRTAAKLGNQQSFYHLGCLFSLLGQYDKAMKFLEKSYEVKSLPPVDKILEDEWLDGLRTTSNFQHFLSYIDKR
jgi:tetratricopeptide (TPR) repeat protein